MYIDVTELFFFSFSVIFNIFIMNQTKINARYMSRNQQKGENSKKKPQTRKSAPKTILTLFLQNKVLKYSGSTKCFTMEVMELRYLGQSLTELWQSFPSHPHADHIKKGFTSNFSLYYRGSSERVNNIINHKLLRFSIY